MRRITSEAGGQAFGRPPELAKAVDIAAELLDVVGPLKRVLRRRLEQELPEGSLPHAQADVLGLIIAQPGIRVQDVGSALRLAANSVSTLVNQLVDGGFVLRLRDPADRRNVRLHPTSAGRDMHGARHGFRRQVLRRAIRQLSPEDHRSIEEALPALHRLVAAVERDS